MCDVRTRMACGVVARGWGFGLSWHAIVACDRLHEWPGLLVMMSPWGSAVPMSRDALAGTDDTRVRVTWHRHTCTLCVWWAEDVDDMTWRVFDTPVCAVAAE